MFFSRFGSSLLSPVKNAPETPTHITAAHGGEPQQQKALFCQKKYCEDYLRDLPPRTRRRCPLYHTRRPGRRTPDDRRPMPPPPPQKSGGSRRASAWMDGHYVHVHMLHTRVIHTQQRQSDVIMHNAHQNSLKNRLINYNKDVFCIVDTFLPQSRISSSPVKTGTLTVTSCCTRSS